jgi:hypothetical protein
MVSNEQLHALAGRSRQPVEDGLCKIAERQLAHRGRRQTEESGPQPQALSADVRHEPVGFHRLEEPVSGGAGEPGETGNFRVTSRSAFDHRQDRHGSIEHAHWRPWDLCW